ncbi:hypothetical protein CJ030_MR1G019289 [Morella rubra]|uniref:Myb/SANT-like domain-containing protein n=1 Tax=Morella rubra TaxID=262757 RepID=A0A6A1WNI7_9ROSI|nr:hypothetical protein CJ030_MR1G019289 [Morella rubra]
MQKNKGKQFRWSKPMRHLLLEILSDEARKGNKMSSTFKPESRARVARAISERFGVECYPNHVKNHLRTVKSVRNTIEAIRNSKRGFGWDENSKMITCERNKHVEEVKAHPNHDKYLNKPIEMYDEMALVAGNDMGIRSSSKPLSDIDCPENLRDLESVVMDLGSEKVSKAKQTGSSSRLLSQLEASLERETKILRKINAVLCENGDSEKALMVMELGGITLMTIMIFLFRIWDEESEEGTSDEEETSDEEY